MLIGGTTLAHASRSRKIPMICSSVNRLGFIFIPFWVMDGTFKYSELAV